MEIRGKVAVVTGAGGGGQGRAVARRLAREGASVVVSDINDLGGRETVRLIEELRGRAAFFRADVGVESDVRELIAFSEQTFGGVDILVNNAGPYFHGMPLEKWTETIHGNLMGTIYGTLYAIEAMRHRGGGAILNFGSTSAVGHGFKPSSSPAYDAAKASATTAPGPARKTCPSVSLPSATATVIRAAPRPARRYWWAISVCR